MFAIILLAFASGRILEYLTSELTQMQNTMHEQIIEYGEQLQYLRLLQTDTKPTPGSQGTNYSIPPINNTSNTNKTISRSAAQGPLYPNYCRYGQNILLNVTQYYCQGVQVLFSQYTALKSNSTNNCESVYRFQYGCYCPPDFSEMGCTLWNKVVCDIENKPCTQVTTDDMDTSCETVDEGLMMHIVSRAICYNQDQSILNWTVWSNAENFSVIWSNYTPGIDGLQVQNFRNLSKPYQEQTTMPADLEKLHYTFAPNKLNYDQPYLKTTLPFNITPIVANVNWKYLTKSYNSQTLRLTPQQILGQATYDQYVQALHPIMGRYSIECQLLITSVSWYDIIINIAPGQYSVQNMFTGPVANYPKLLYFKDSKWVEPKSTSRQSFVILIVIIVVLIIVLVVSCYVLRYYKNKRLAEPVHPEEVQQIQ